MRPTGNVVPIGAVKRLPLVCAWKGCDEKCDSARMLPSGWLALATFRDTARPGLLDFRHDRVVRDAVLCPFHVTLLEECLKPLR